MNVLLRDLDCEDYTLLQDSQDLEWILNMVGLPTEYRPDITGAVVEVGEGELLGTWFTESSRPFDLTSVYHPLAYYTEA